MPHSDVEVSEVETPDGRAFTVEGRIEWERLPPDHDGPTPPETVTVTGLTELFEDEARAPRRLSSEEMAAMVAEHGELFAEEIRDQAQAWAEAAAEAREEHSRRMRRR